MSSRATSIFRSHAVVERALREAVGGRGSNLTTFPYNLDLTFTP